MNRVLFTCLVAAIAASVPSRARADLIATWTFETVTPADVTDSSLFGPSAADVGVGTVSAFHTLATTDYTTPSGNGSANALSSNSWTTGDNYEFDISMAGFTDLTMTFDATSSATGPHAFVVQYSTDDVTYLDLITYTTSSTGWSSTTPAATSFSADFSAITAIDGDATVFIRLTSTEGGAAAGTSRIDNISFSATSAVPEPTSMGLLGLAGLGALLRRRRAAT